MKQFLAISAIGKDRPGLAHDVVRTIADCGASINESRMLPLGGELAMQILRDNQWRVVEVPRGMGVSNAWSALEQLLTAA